VNKAGRLQHFIVERQPAEQIGELLLNNFLANIGLLAATLISGAMIVDVTLFLDLAYD
jgi:hypothetical protein